MSYDEIQRRLERALEKAVTEWAKIETGSDIRMGSWQNMPYGRGMDISLSNSVRNDALHAHTPIEVEIRVAVREGRH